MAQLFPAPVTHSEELDPWPPLLNLQKGRISFWQDLRIPRPLDLLLGLRTEASWMQGGLRIVWQLIAVTCCNALGRRASPKSDIERGWPSRGQTNAFGHRNFCGHGQAARLQGFFSWYSMGSSPIGGCYI